MHSNLIPGAILLLSLSCASGPGAGITPPDVVTQVDLSRYLGTWFEIASFPQRFQRGCADTKAVYSLRADGTIEVLNSCFRNGKTDVAKGKAWVVDKTTNAKLKVSFFWPFRGDYWIIELGRDYEYAVVSAPSRKYLWILAREPRMDETLYASIIEQLRARGFDIAKLQRTVRTG